ncbi:RodZ domain-containing protein [Desulfosporosinus metallidurans]|uniref:Transcriptional regulator in cluster with unspecified monosaccharide ABC transport system n=1 Tax=Desulfosporosinus metallidurans TaxID=1888891 RepID=A0A1Q8R2N4_9FIRM|nr:RodZ domain-containing protein [Desulfosporosinus metallidurans]OLN33818.1 Transcriptional regulator in cluster with unspecified monosaccharide ABC transport system [Desulfosporosinus metallidurans]
MAGEGQMLRAAREEKQWSLTYTEEITKIRVRYIQALEAEEYEILPGTTYAKGYLRTYSKQLGLNPDEIIALYNPTLTPEAGTLQIRPQMPMIKSRPLWVRPVKVGIMAAVAIGLVFGISYWTQSHEKIAETPYTAPLPSAPKTETSAPAPSVPTPSVPASQSSPSNVVAATQDGLTAQLVFTQPCWIVVQVDGQPSFQGTFASGTSKEVKGASKIELVSVGNAGGLSVTLNGKALPTLGKSGEVLRNVVLTPDMLKSL